MSDFYIETEGVGYRWRIVKFDTPEKAELCNESLTDSEIMDGRAIDETVDVFRRVEREMERRYHDAKSNLRWAQQVQKALEEARHG